MSEEYIGQLGQELDAAQRCIDKLQTRIVELEEVKRELVSIIDKQSDRIAEIERKLKEIREIKKLVENKDGDEIRNSHDTGAAWDVGFERGYNNALKDCQRIANEMDDWNKDRAERELVTHRAQER